MDSGTVKKEPLSATEIFERDCPFMLSLGMSYELYWYGDPLAARSFYEAFRHKERNTHAEAWLQGIYISYAISSTIGNAFRGKGEKPYSYPEQPLINLEEEEMRLADAEKRREKERLLARIYMDNMIRAGADWGKNEVVTKAPS